MSNVQEVKARKGVVIAVVTQGDTTIRDMASFSIEIPEVNEARITSYNVCYTKLLRKWC